MTFIEPLELGTWFVNVISGDPIIFTALAIISIALLAAYFRMPGATMFLMVGLFLGMFSDYLVAYFFPFALIIGGLVIGYMIISFTRSN